MTAFRRVCTVASANDGAFFERFYGHWLNTHVPNVKSVMDEVGGFRYVVSNSIDHLTEPYAGLAELHFHDDAGWSRNREVIKLEGMEERVDRGGTLVLDGRTDMIGLP